jgi:hypothetical protein
MADDNILASTLILGIIHRRRRRRQARRCWVRPIFSRRRQQGDFHNLIQELRLSDPESYFRYMRMSKERFDDILSKVGPLLTRRYYSCGVRAETERLAVTLLLVIPRFHCLSVFIWEDLWCVAL